MPVYEYRCPNHGVFEVFHQTIPVTVSQEEACPARCYRAAPEGRRLALCYMISKLVPSLGVYGDAALGPMMRLSRERRRYHDRAPEREKALHERKASRKNVITSAEVEERMERQR